MKNKVIGITGAGGQLGYYCAQRFRHHFGCEVLTLDHSGFSDDGSLAEFVEASDCVIHLAGVNRGSDEEVRDGNPAIASRLVQAAKDASTSVDIVYASSIQVDRENLYGKSKQAAGDILQDYCREAGSDYFEFILPNLFGEFSRPFYNNVTATFCSQIAKGEAPTINGDSPIQLMHYCEVADHFHEAMLEGKSGSFRPQGHDCTIKELAEKIGDMDADYRGSGVIPDLRSAFDLNLFNTYRQNLVPDFFPVKLTRHADARGSFFECVRERNGGQVSFSTTVPGITRGEHFHFHKVERFLVLSGNAQISMRKMGSDKRHDFVVSGDEPCFVDMPTLYTHNITNIGDTELLTLFWINDFYNPDLPDTYLETV